MTEIKEKTSVLFVCMGNICRSPTAEGVFRKLVEDAGLEKRISADSAGTHAYHAGEGPDRRATEAAARRGFTLAKIRARRVVEDDFEIFDHILAMDNENLLILEEQAGESHRQKLRLFLEFARSVPEREVPDPYYGGPAGFEKVLDLVEDAAAGLLDAIRKDIGVRT